MASILKHSSAIRNVSNQINLLCAMCKHNITNQGLNCNPSQWSITGSLTHHVQLSSGRSIVLTKKLSEERRNAIAEGPGLKDFLQSSTMLETNITGSKPGSKTDFIPYIKDVNTTGRNRKVYFDIYGCQMNVNDTEVIWSILKGAGFLKTDQLEGADVVLVVTCAIREGAETKVWNKLEYLKGLKNVRARKKDLPQMKIGLLGCMAERLKHRLLEKEQAVDLVAGPDSYKDLPRLLALTDNNQTAVNVLLSLDETYADVMPVRLNQDSVTAFVSIMRGCDNMCSYCIVPFTRGRERSRPISSILHEVQQLSHQGVKEITLLGQNVNSYRDMSETLHYSGLAAGEETHQAVGFKTVYKKKKGGVRFADLLEKVSAIDPEMRIRFTSPHPKDFPDEVLQLIATRSNICRNLHLPAQSGSSSVLERMRRGYNRESYLDLVARVRQLLPSVAISSDFICGFCGETDDEFNETLTLMAQVRYSVAYLFPYSMREKTSAHRRMVDDIPDEVKHRRLVAMVTLYREQAEKLNQAMIGEQQLVLVEGTSKRSKQQLVGRNDGNVKVIFPCAELPTQHSDTTLQPVGPGDYVLVQITAANSQVLHGIALAHSSIAHYSSMAL